MQSGVPMPSWQAEGNRRGSVIARAFATPRRRFQTPPSILVLMSLAGILASLRDRHSGPPMMGSEGCGGPISRYVLAVRLTAGIKTRNGLASSIVPAGTSLHRVGGIQFSPIAIVHN